MIKKHWFARKIAIISRHKKRYTYLLLVPFNIGSVTIFISLIYVYTNDIHTEVCFTDKGGANQHRV